VPSAYDVPLSRSTGSSTTATAPRRSGLLLPARDVRPAAKREYGYYVLPISPRRPDRRQDRARASIGARRCCA
jgi:hypothetical protein